MLDPLLRLGSISISDCSRNWRLWTVTFCVIMAAAGFMEKSEGRRSSDGGRETESPEQRTAYQPERGPGLTQRVPDVLWVAN